MSILPFVVIDGGPYRQRLLSASPPWRPPPTRLLYSSSTPRVPTTNHSLKLASGPGLKRPKLPYGAGFVCVCVERDREKERVWERVRHRIKEKKPCQFCSRHISRYDALSLQEISETIYWMTVGMNWAGIFWHCEFPWLLFLSVGPCDLYHLGFNQAQNQYIYILRFIMRNRLILLWELAEQLQNL